VGGDTGEDGHPVKTFEDILVVGVDESHPESCQSKVFAHTPQEVNSLRVR